MPKPLISVLMPVHAFTPFTRIAVGSVLAQTHSELELLIIGKEDSPMLANQLPDDDRIRVVPRNAPGIVGALNTGLPLCNGDYIARMDSDDVCNVNRLDTQLALAHKHPDVGLIASRVRIFSDTEPVGNGNKQYEQWLNSLTTPEHIQQACLIESPMPHPSLFAHRDYWARMQGYRDNDWPEDYDLILRTWLANIPMAKPDAVLLNWREHPQRLTRTDTRYDRQAFIRAKAWALTQPESGLNLDHGRRVWICGTGRNARYWHDALAERHVTVLGFVELDNVKQKKQKRHLPVINYKTLASAKTDTLVVSAISGTLARKALVNWFEEQNMQANQDFVLGG